MNYHSVDMDPEEALPVRENSSKRVASVIMMEEYSSFLKCFQSKILCHSYHLCVMQKLNLYLCKLMTKDQEANTKIVR